MISYSLVFLIEVSSTSQNRSIPTHPLRYLSLLSTSGEEFLTLSALCGHHCAQTANLNPPLRSFVQTTAEKQGPYVWRWRPETQLSRRVHRWRSFLLRAPFLPDVANHCMLFAVLLLMMVIVPRHELLARREGRAGRRVRIAGPSGSSTALRRRRGRPPPEKVVRWWRLRQATVTLRASVDGAVRTGVRRRWRRDRLNVAVGWLDENPRRSIQGRRSGLLAFALQRVPPVRTFTVARARPRRHSANQRANHVAQAPTAAHLLLATRAVGLSTSVRARCSVRHRARNRLVLARRHSSVTVAGMSGKAQ